MDELVGESLADFPGAAIVYSVVRPTILEVCTTVLSLTVSRSQLEIVQALSSLFFLILTHSR